MITTLRNWPGALEINGVFYNSIQDAPQISSEKFFEPISIKLFPRQKVQEAETSVKEYRITVKRYMTQKATPEFDFMAKWNKDIPMPLVTMTGTKEKETRGMVYMKLHGDIWAEKIHRCMKCGRVLTNPVSQYFGIGPECGGHNYVNPFDTKEELQAAVDSYKKELQDIKWEGWIIKSAIKEEVEV